MKEDSLNERRLEGWKLIKVGFEKKNYFVIIIFRLLLIGDSIKIYQSVVIAYVSLFFLLVIFRYEMEIFAYETHEKKKIFSRKF